MKSKASLVILLFSIPSVLYARHKTNNASIPYILVPYRVKNQWGFSDQAGNIKIKPVYTGVKEIRYYWTDGNEFKNLMVVAKGNETFAINHLNHVIVPANKGFDNFELDPYSYETVIAKKSNKEALYYDGKELLPCVYDDIERLANISFRFRGNNLVGLINSSGKIIVPQKILFLGFGNIIADKLTWNARNDIKAKSEIFEDQRINDTIPRYHTLGSATLRSTSDVKEGNLHLYIDSAIKVLQSNHQNLRPDENHPHLVYIGKNGKKGLYNAILKKMIIPCEYEEIKVSEVFSAEIIIFIKKGHYGVMGEWGNVIVPPIFDAIYGKRFPYTLVKGKQVGMLTESITYVKPMYKEIKYSDTVYDFKAKSNIQLFEVATRTGKKGFINDKGFEYFKD